ncbi:Acetyltransferase (GNAT) family protein [Halovenus aranensis]|jgi:ribosomal protein S18 acetylase RimI-like enzyme|uniref:Acetyltransferase (GNAT) family protein n=1 Tax=Halovenus aranensis TaxID=890420 RepID=A0A1G8TH65_9EURY|nr:GNAT family N-acetyltransferase [Halovenus aranensis]SDJ40757.1 Acetyltransferase (GNAT) family protein [Halovenus aranensis]
MEILTPSLSAAERLVEQWLSLAESQRRFESHLLVSENRTRIRESICNHIATGRLLVARDEAIRGFIMFTIEVGGYEQDVTRGLIENLYVDPDYRNDGVGSRLLGNAETELQTQGADVVTLDVMAANEAGRRFYRRHGYEPHRLELEKDISEREE